MPNAKAAMEIKAMVHPLLQLNQMQAVVDVSKDLLAHRVHLVTMEKLVSTENTAMMVNMVATVKFYAVLSHKSLASSAHPDLPDPKAQVVTKDLEDPKERTETMEVMENQDPKEWLDLPETKDQLDHLACLDPKENLVVSTKSMDLPAHTDLLDPQVVSVPKEYLELMECLEKQVHKDLLVTKDHKEPKVSQDLLDHQEAPDLSETPELATTAQHHELHQATKLRETTLNTPILGALLLHETVLFSLNCCALFSLFFGHTNR